MSLYNKVNGDLQRMAYRPHMVQKRGVTGSPKGQTKPRKRALDPDFPKRLNSVFALHPGLTVPDLAREIGCTRAVLWNYLNGNNKTVEALLLFTLADRLKVSARWLLTGAGAIDLNEALTPDQARVLQTFSQLADEGTRDFWISQGEDLTRRQPPLIATAADPYNGTKTPGTVHQPHRPYQKAK